MTSKLFRWIGTAVFMVAVSVGLPSNAATIFVNTTDDELTANGACSLREALRNANSNASIHGDCAAGSGNDTIQVQPGTIRLTIGGASEDNAFTGDLDIRDSVTISGTPGGNTIVDATVAADRVFHVIGNIEVQIDNLRITGGWSSSGSGLYMSSGAVLLFRADVVANTSTGPGGGVTNVGGVLQLDTVFMDSNTASTTGGAIQSSSNLTIANSLIQNNEAASAGAIYMVGGQLQITNSDLASNTASNFGGALLVTNSTTSTDIVGGSFHFNEAPRGAAMQLNLPYSITGTTIRDNTATVDGAIRSRSNGTISGATFLRNVGGAGGAIAHEVGNLDVIDSTFTDNDASSGGAINNEADATLTDCTLDGNQAVAGIGGSILNDDALTLVRTTVSDSTATTSGGGIYSNGGVTTLSYSALIDNTAQGSGGGIYVTQASADLDLFNTTVSGNLAGDLGGGIYVRDGAMTVDYSTIADNRTVSPGNTGAGVYLDSGQVEPKNSLFGLNSPTNYSGSGTGTVISAGFNSADDNSCVLVGPNDVNNVNLQLQPLAANGGPTMTHALGTSSPARDTAAFNCQMLAPGAIDDDQRLMPRPVEGDGSLPVACDRGAFEGSNPFSVTPLPVGDGTFAPPMLASYNGGNQVNVQWDVLFCLSQDYHLLYGDLSQVDQYQPQAAICGLGQGGSASSLPIGAGDKWFLIVGDDGFDVEGSWGQATSGERNGTTGSGMCSMNIRDNSATCP